MSYKLNVEYLQTQKEIDSELTTALAEYDGVLPLLLYHVYNPYHDSLGMPNHVREFIHKIHGDKWVEHGRYEAFKLPGESWVDCEDRLSKVLLDEINLPILIEVK